MTPHTVRQGEYLAKIAMRFGCSIAAIWDDPANADLAKLRDPNILLPGDVLWVPDVPRKWLPTQTGATNVFNVIVPTIPVRLVFGDESAPFANEACEVDGLPDSGEDPPETTDGDGALVLEVPVYVWAVQVTFPDKGLSYAVQVGFMDPIDTPVGVRKRIHNLGYYDIDSNEAGADEAQILAIAAFQAGEDLPVTGEFDDDTRAALLAAHGS